MMYYKPTPLFRSKFLYRYRALIYGNSHHKSMIYYKPTPLFRADVREIAHGLIIRTILAAYISIPSLTLTLLPHNVHFICHTRLPVPTHTSVCLLIHTPRQPIVCLTLHAHTSLPVHATRIHK